MLRLRAEGLNQIYYDNNNKNDYSPISAGFLLRTSSAGLKTAYIDCKQNSKKLINLLENLSLISEFRTNLSKFHIEIFSPTQGDKIQKSIIPLVEYYNISSSSLLNEILKFEVIIIEDLDFEIISENLIMELLKNKNILSEVIITTSSKDTFKKLENIFHIAIKIKKNEFPLQKNKEVVILDGCSYGQTPYLLGLTIKEYLKKKDIKYISFKKNIKNTEDNIFKSLKKIQNNVLNYGKLDYVFLNNSNQIENEIKPEEINNQLMLLETSIHKQSPVIVENLLDLIHNKEYLDKINKIISKSKNELIISTQNSEWKKSNINPYITISFENTKNEDYPLRFGIDF